MKKTVLNKKKKTKCTLVFGTEAAP